jgi:hypothetical protein
MLGNVPDAAIMAAPTTPAAERTMSDKIDTEREADGMADAIAVTAIMGVIVLAMYLWLSGMPG